jgi:hypothetical protein
LTNRENSQNQLKRLKELNLLLRSQLELAEARIAPLNDQLAQLARIDFLHNEALFGAFVYHRAYSNPGAGDGSLLLQAAILIPGGIGLVAWDREEYFSLEGPDGPTYRDARPRFTPFHELDHAQKALLLPQVEPLLDQLFARVGLKDSPSGR